ncbi:MAG: hypothetical protein IPK12_08430 [Gemmatimonadetes bacterium]|nr:hypothetical protein [Gemmatimonadota bacterium]
MADRRPRPPLEQPPRRLAGEEAGRPGAEHRRRRRRLPRHRGGARRGGVGLFAALPAPYRAQLAGLPATIEALEARAAEARAELERLAALGGSGAGDGGALAARQRAAQAHLSDSVAALEGVRLDLLRLHAGSADLAPLTTLLEAARQIGEDVGRLAEAQQEVRDATTGR